MIPFIAPTTVSNDASHKPLNNYKDIQDTLDFHYSRCKRTPLVYGSEAIFKSGLTKTLLRAKHNGVIHPDFPIPGDWLDISVSDGDVHYLYDIKTFGFLIVESHAKRRLIGDFTNVFGDLPRLFVDEILQSRTQSEYLQAIGED